MKFEIKIGGKLRPVSFGTNQTGIYCEKKNIPIEEIGEINKNFSILQFRDFLWSGLAAGVYEKGEHPDFTEWDVGTWVDEMKPEDITMVMDKFTQSMPLKKKTIPEKARQAVGKK